MRLRSIPPQTAMKRSSRPRHSAKTLHTIQALRHESQSWQPQIYEKIAQAKSLFSRKVFEEELFRNIDRLTQEIAQWLPEFGEEALLKLYEERARWTESRH